MNAHEKIIHALKLENEELRRRLQQYESAGKQALVDEPVIGQKKRLAWIYCSIIFRP